MLLWSPQTSLKATPAPLIWRWICFYPDKKKHVRISLCPIQNHESQLPPQVPVKKLKFGLFFFTFLLKCMWFTRN